MKTRTPFRRMIFWIVLALLVVAYPLYWHIEIATTVVDPDQFLDPTGITIAVAIILGFFYYGALWLAALIYESILFATKKISKRKFLISLGVLLGVLITVGSYLLVSNLIA